MIIFHIIFIFFLKIRFDGFPMDDTVASNAQLYVSFIWFAIKRLRFLQIFQCSLIPPILRRRVTKFNQSINHFHWFNHFTQFNIVLLYIKIYETVLPKIPIMPLLLPTSPTTRLSLEEMPRSVRATRPRWPPELFVFQSNCFFEYLMFFSFFQCSKSCCWS